MRTLITGGTLVTAEGAAPMEVLIEDLGALRALPPRVSVLEGLTYRSVYTVTQAHDGGRGRNVVPDAFVLNLNHRFAADRTTEQAKADLIALVRERAEVLFTDLSPAAAPSAREREGGGAGEWRARWMP